MGNEAVIEYAIWRIIEEEIQKYINNIWIDYESSLSSIEDGDAKKIVANIKRRINKILNRYEAILVYQP